MEMMSRTFAVLTLAKTALRPVLIAGALAALVFADARPSGAAGGAGHEIERQNWVFAGMFGRFDRKQLQRGYQVFSENCAGCHGIKRVYFRNLADKGGLEFAIDRVKALAATFEIDDGPNAEGDMFKRPARLSDSFPSPFANDNAARAANNGALPPDLSLITRARTIQTNTPFYLVPFTFLANMVQARQEDGADYLYALLTSYAPAPAYKRGAQDQLTAVAAAEARDTAGDLKPGYLECVSVRTPTVDRGAQPKPDVCNPLAEGMNYNPAFPGGQIAMPPPLAKDVFVEYQDGSGSMAQNAQDLTAFLVWTAEPKLEKRKALGFTVIIYLLIMTVLLYLAKRRIWSRLEH